MNNEQEIKESYCIRPIFQMREINIVYLLKLQGTPATIWLGIVCLPVGQMEINAQ